MRKPSEDEMEDYRQQANEEAYERRNRIPRNTDPYYPECYHIADHTPDEMEEEE
jgi:hypothetical protein